MREHPKTGEIWKHYKGEECRILGILRNGNREQLEQLIVAYELLKNPAPEDRFYRSIEDFMGAVSIGNEWIDRFVRSDDDITADIWEKSFALCEI